MKIFQNPLKAFTKFELSLWAFSVICVTVSFVLPSEKDYLTLCASLCGVTALIYSARGYVMAQILSIAFSLLYGIISIIFGYWGEALTYLCMTMPAAIAATVSWLRHPYEKTAEVEVSKMTKKKVWLLLALLPPVTAVFCVALWALDTPNLFFSTVSISTSFVASYLAFMRSPFFALAYSFNDIVLIILWGFATAESVSYLPMVICFVMFLINDTYGFISWQKRKRRQGRRNADFQTSQA